MAAMLLNQREQELPSTKRRRSGGNRRDRKNKRHATSPASGGVGIGGGRGRGAGVRFGSVGMAWDDQGRIGGSDGRGVAVRAGKGFRPTARRGGRQMAWAEVTDDLAERRPQAGGARGWRRMAARMRSMASRAKIVAMGSSVPRPQFGQVRMSMS